MRERFDGSITGWGTASGLRCVIGSWEASPFGAFTDVMVAHPDGRRELLAPSAEIAEYVSTTYHFDDVRVVPIQLSSREGMSSLTAVPLAAEYRIGERQLWSVALRAIPSVLVSPGLARVMNPVASRAMPGVRTYGSAGHGRREYYVARDLRDVTLLGAVWDGRALGHGGPVVPEPNFGFSSTPRRPSWTRITTFVETT